MKAVKIKINDKIINAKSGETVLQAAIKAGIRIPTLCYHPDLEPYGGCRLCIVEIKGIKNPLTACTLPVKDGMEIKTNTARLNALRRFTLQLILSEHPQSCLICQKKNDCADYQHCIEKVPITTGCKFCSKNGQCELQSAIEEIGLEQMDFSFEYRNQEIERFDPFFDRDYNLCILCGRCTRACQDLRGVATLDFHHRGPKTLVGTAFGLSHLETGCQFCGACVDVCPTGALADRFARWHGSPEDNVKSTCMLCGIACSIKANIKKDDIVSVQPDQDLLCVRGRFGIAPLTRHPMRASFPMIKKNGQLKRVSFQQAVDTAADELMKHKDKGRIGIIFSPQITIEAIDRLIVLARGLDAVIAPSLKTDAYKDFTVKSISRKSCFIFMNIDMIGEFSPVLLRLRRLAPDAGVIIIDSVGSAFDDRADLVVKVKPGTELEGLKELIRSRSAKTRIVSMKELNDFKNISTGRKIYLIYNPGNIIGIEGIAGLTPLPLLPAVNAAYLHKQHLSDSQTLLSDQGIDCLFVVGRVPFLSRKYKSIICQDCFVPGDCVDVFFPAAAFTEIQGRIVGFDGRIKRIKPVRPMLDESQSDKTIIDMLNKKMAIAPVKSGKKSWARTVPPVQRYKKPANDSWYLIVRESGYAYRNNCLSSLLKGFERIRSDRYLHLNPESAKKLNIKQGDSIRVIGMGTAFTCELPVHISDQVPPRAALLINSGNYAGLSSQTVRLECIR